MWKLRQRLARLWSCRRLKADAPPFDFRKADSMTVVEIARLFLFVRELEGNTGARVEAIQRWGGGKPGDAWCAFWATMVLDLAFAGNATIPRTGSCDAILNLARSNKWLSDTPRVGDLYLYLKTPDDAVHVGIVTDVDVTGYTGISGNTSEDGLSSNGDRVAERRLQLRPGKTVFVRYPRP